MPSRWIVGLSSGACAEGVDAVLLELEGVGLDLRLRQLRGLHQAFPSELRDLVRRVGSPTPIDPRRLAHVHRMLGETYAAAGRAIADRAGRPSRASRPSAAPASPSATTATRDFRDCCPSACPASSPSGAG